LPARGDLFKRARAVFERAERGEAEGLYNIPERGDRLIAATAVHLGCPLLTNDPAITRSPTVATLW
jgi:predicted nucleic acid-binding protein